MVATIQHSDRPQLVMSAFCEVIVEVQQDRRSELIWVQSKLLKLLILIQDVVLAQCAAHVQYNAIIFPSVAASVRVVAQVSLQDLSQGLLRAHLHRGMCTNAVKVSST